MAEYSNHTKIRYTNLNSMNQVYLPIELLRAEAPKEAA